MKRYKTVILVAPEGNDFVVSQKDSGELRIKLIPTIDTEYPGDYTNPPIPEGWEHVEGEWNNGFVIQDSKGNQFVWVPVGMLDSNGIIVKGNRFELGPLNNLNTNEPIYVNDFSEKFGRRNYNDEEFSDNEFHEELEGEL